MNIAVIGGGISGLSVAQMLGDRHNVVVYEADNRPGGLIKCNLVEGSLFHITGGHVFNTKRQDVYNWFWGQFDVNTEFTKAVRNAIVMMGNGLVVPYPIEDHVYYFDKVTQNHFIEDLLSMAKNNDDKLLNFEEFLLNRFGKTLYELYFKPYNYKVWRRDLKQVALSWLEGKLPMPTLQEMIYNNMNHLEETNFVHSSFYYPVQGGSQFIIDRLANNLNIQCNTPINEISKVEQGWLINGEIFDKVIFCGNLKKIPDLINTNLDIAHYTEFIEELEYHGTTSVFCEIDKNPYSWVYLPSEQYQAHRIICTGNFAESNNDGDKMTATVEFTDYISKEDIQENLSKIPLSPHYLTHNFAEYTYPIQSADTRSKISALKETLEKDGFYLLGRFAEWEYYNMDVAVGAAIDLSKRM